MTSEWTNPAGCNCLALRQAARHVSQFYDQFLAPSGLRTTQYSILARLQRKGAMTINALAAELVTDRTTLGRNLLPLQRDGLIAIGPGQSDRRSKEVRLTGAGAARFRAALKAWRGGAGAVRNRVRRQARQGVAGAVARDRDRGADRDCRGLERDPEKHALGLDPWVEIGFPLDHAP